jgi:aromatic ring hydroxylase
MESAAVDKASARVVEKNSDGIIVQGTLLLATQGGMTEEILVFPSPYPFEEMYTTVVFDRVLVRGNAFFFAAGRSCPEPFS